MLPIKVALVSQVKSVAFDEAAHVAAALTMQVSRDLKPIWGIEATVAAFPTIHKVPVGYWPIFIVDNLPPTEGGFHLTKHKQPYAKVEAGDSWSLSASHELIEMLIDPSGSRLAAGPELVVSHGKVAEDPTKHVQYLLEACDPCESAHQAYLIEDVVVSDFITPHFHDPVPSPGTRYSFTGALQHPRHILPEGYISWFDPAKHSVMQLQYFGAPKVVNLTAAGQAKDLSLRELAHDGVKLPKLSTLGASHALAKRRTDRREALHRAGEAAAALYAV